MYEECDLWGIRWFLPRCYAARRRTHCGVGCGVVGPTFQLRREEKRGGVRAGEEIARRENNFRPRGSCVLCVRRRIGQDQEHELAKVEEHGFPRRPAWFHFA